MYATLAALIAIIVSAASIISGKYVSKSIKKFTKDEIYFFYEELKKISQYIEAFSCFQFAGGNKDKLWKDPKTRKKNILKTVGLLTVITVIALISALREIDFSTVSTHRLILGFLSPVFFFAVIYIMIKFGRQRNFIDQITLNKNYLEITLLNDKDYTTQDVKTPIIYKINEIDLKYQIKFNSISDWIDGHKKSHYLYIKNNTDKTKKYALFIYDDGVENIFRALITFANILSRNIDINAIQNLDEVEEIIRYSCK